MGNFYELDQVKAIPILDICDMFGIHVKSKMCKIRDEKTPSCKIYTDSSNGFDSFYDFGTATGGDVIKFVMEITGQDWQSSLETLANAFGIPPVNNIEYLNRSELSDREYGLIGVSGDRVSKNLDFDLERYSLESCQKFSDKYSMSVNELRLENPRLYTYYILSKRAIPYVKEIENSYYMELYNHYSLRRNLNVATHRIGESFLPEFESLRKKLVTAERLLVKAAKGTSMEHVLKAHNYDVNEDYKKIINGEIAIPVGSISYYEIKQAASKSDSSLCYRAVAGTQYFCELSEMLDGVPHAAFLKVKPEGEEVNLAFLPEDELFIRECIDRINSKNEQEKEQEGTLDERINMAQEGIDANDPEWLKNAMAAETTVGFNEAR